MLFLLACYRCCSGVAVQSYLQAILRIGMEALGYCTTTVMVYIMDHIRSCHRFGGANWHRPPYVCVCASPCRHTVTHRQSVLGSLPIHRHAGTRSCIGSPCLRALPTYRYAGTRSHIGSPCLRALLACKPSQQHATMHANTIDVACDNDLPVGGTIDC